MDADKIKDFFLFHCEKMILVLVIAGSGFLLYQGFGKESYLKDHDPKRLGDNATQVKLEVDENHNDDIIPDRVPTFDIVANTEKRYNPVYSAGYALDSLWNGEDKLEAISRRQDPMLLPPRHLLTNGVVGVISIRAGSQGAYAAYNLEPADELEKIEQPVKRERPSRPRRGRGGGIEAMMFMDEEMEMQDEEMELEMEMPLSGSMAGAGRKLSSEFDFGTPNSGMTEARQFPKPLFQRFIAGTAVIPHKEVYQAFEAALRDAEDYQPRRDTPYYYDFEVQRADVTEKSVDQLVDSDWSLVWNRLRYTKLGGKYWYSFAPEIVPEDYRDDLITTWIPPILLDDYAWFSTHPLIPMKSQAVIKQEAMADEGEVVVEDLDSILGEENESDVILAAPGARGGLNSGPVGMMIGSMDEMEMGMGMTLGFGPVGVEKDPVDYKLLRFYDFFGIPGGPEEGRKYVYRLRYAVNDPNFPANPEMQPKPNALAPEAALRVRNLMDKAIESGERDYRRWTDWSEPTEPTSLPVNEQFYAGKVKPGNTYLWDVAGRKVPYVKNAPTATIVASQYDAEYAARVPLRLEVAEGAVLSRDLESADLVDPIELDVKKLPDAKLRTRATIVDLDGGRPLSIVDELTEPGMMLLLDSTGKLRVHDDIADQEMYRIWSFADERGE